MIHILTGNASGTSGLLSFRIGGKLGLQVGDFGSGDLNGNVVTNDQVYEVVQKLITCERLMESLHLQTVVKGQMEVDSEEIHLMYLNSFLLLLIYNRCKESSKVLKYLD